MKVGCEKMTEKELGTGLLTIKDSIGKRFPELSDSEIERVTAIILNEVAKHISAGEQLAFFRLRDDGSAEIIAYELEKMGKDS